MTTFGSWTAAPNMRPLLLAALLLLGGCSFLQPAATVNGWSVGPLLACADQRCRDEIPVAQAALEEYYPNHPELVALEIHEEGGYRDPVGNVVLVTRSGGCCEVALFRFVDGTIWAIGVGYVGVSDFPSAVPQPPRLD